MKITFLFTVFFVLSFFAMQAQDLSNCKNPCKKTKIVQSGPFIGLRTIDLADSQYVRVVEVVKNGPSHKNGILLHDTITHFNGEVIQSMRYFIGEVAKLNPGDTVTVTVYRNGEVTDYRYPLGALQTKKVTEIECCDPEPVYNDILFVLRLDNSQNTLTISTDEIIGSDVLINILDVNGTTLKTEKTKKNKRGFEISIDISDIDKGIYFVKIFVDNTQYTRRFTKE